MPLIACPKCDYEFDSRAASCPKCGEVMTGILRQHAGKLIDGKYRLLKRLGRGGMGEVYKAEHVHLGTTRVIKVMRPQLVDDKESQDRFLREARLATRIQHPNVATLHDFSTLPDGSYYMVWEFIDGTDFSAYSKSGEPLTAGVAIRLVIHALAGLGAVHAAGIVHRDISPDNLMVHTDPTTGEPSVEVIALGSAKADAVDGALTGTGIFIGKWRYASPEHLGVLESDQKIDGRADLFSMAIVLYELLTGETPFNAETPGQYVLLHAADRPNPVTLESVSIPTAPGVEPVLVKALARDREERYGTASEFATALEEVLEQLEGPDAPPTMVLTPTPDVPFPLGPEPTVQTDGRSQAPDKKQKTLIAAAAAAAVFAVLFAGALLLVLNSLKGGESPAPRAAVATMPPAPSSTSGETVEIQFEEPAVTADTATESSEAALGLPSPDPAEPEPATAAPKPAAAPAPLVVRRKPVKPEPELTEPPSTEPSQPPVMVPPPPPPPVTDSIPGTGERLFGWRSKRLVDSREYKEGFRKGIIRDYSDMWSRGGCDWASVARGVYLADYAIEISTFRNLTSVDNEDIRYWLEELLQEELDGIAGEKGTVTTENVIYWASDEGDSGIGIEMIFRTSSGRVLAKIRHEINEDSAADAAEEMAEVVADFIEDHEVIE